MGQITFSETMGMLEAGCDHIKFVQSSKKSTHYFACVSPGIFPLVQEWVN